MPSIRGAPANPFVDGELVRTRPAFGYQGSRVITLHREPRRFGVDRLSSQVQGYGIWLIVSHKRSGLDELWHNMLRLEEDGRITQGWSSQAGHDFYPIPSGEPESESAEEEQLNIFVLDEDPILAARAQCDKHVVKMIVESAQRLCNALPEDLAFYRRTHYNHPCSAWTRSSRENYLWLSEHALELSREYTRRYKKTHATQPVLDICRELADLVPPGALTPFAVCVPDDCKNEATAVASYRKYYVVHKSRFAKWRHSPAPSWYPVHSASDP